MRFEGKAALVTGAAGGIGAAIVRLLGAEGARVAAADRDTGGIAAEAHLPGDLLDPAYADGLARAARDALGGLDIVVNNAGVITRGPVTDSTDADWTLSLGVNVEAPFRICRAAIPLMAEAGGGAIVNVSSCWGGKAPGPNHALYCMTKAAIASLTQCMGMDHAHQGIRVNAVNPGLIDTEIHDASGIPGRLERLVGGVPEGRVGAAEEVAQAVVWLLSERSSYVCGALVPVSGGR